MKNNYPIKYAVIPIIEQVGWSPGLHELEREYGTVCYIVSKCYLVGEEKKYKQNGEVTTKYKVVPTYEKNPYLRGWSRIEPLFDVNGDCCNCFRVSGIFDNYEEANAAKNVMNDRLFADNFFSFSKIEEERKKFDKTLRFYNRLEVEIEKNSTNLQVNKKSKEQSFLFLYEGEIFKKEMPVYDIIDYSMYDYENYVIYSVSEEEYKKIQKNKTFDLKKYSHTPLIRHESSYTKMIEILSRDETEKFYMTTGRNRKQITEPVNLEFSEELDKAIFTTEDFVDITESYDLKPKYKKILTLKNK